MFMVLTSKVSSDGLFLEEEMYLQTDLHHCYVINDTKVIDNGTCNVVEMYGDYSNNTACMQCIESDSIFIDYSNDRIYEDCKPYWINGLCARRKLKIYN